MSRPEPGARRPDRRRPSTPGLAGYLAAWALSCLVTVAGAAGIALADPSADQPLLDALVVLTLGSFWVPLYSLPFAVVGIPLVHLACRRVEAQWVHVVAAGAAGLLPALAVRLMTGEWIWAWASIAACTALGRLAVVPMVRQRRDSAAPAATG